MKCLVIEDTMKKTWNYKPNVTRRLDKL